jgi:hypothetical protein
MRYYIHSKNNDLKEYTLQLIIRECEQREGASIVDSPKDADYVLVSICDITEAKEILKARHYGKPVITGGLLSELPIINELSDYVWHGEIYGFFEMMERSGVDDIPYITSKRNRKLRINEAIMWKENPIVLVGKKSCYYYTSKGCPIRCKFCMISAARTYQQCPEPVYRARERQISKAKKQMMPIAAYNPYENESTRGVTEVLMRKYNARPLDKVRLVRCGMEFVREEYSKNLAKGVTVADLDRFLAITATKKSKAIIYFIAGLETTEEIIDALSGLSQDYRTIPAVTLNWTYLAPQHYTPMYDLDIRCRASMDPKAVFSAINQINKRLRVNPLAPITKSTIRCMMERTVSVGEFAELSKLMNKYADVDNDALYRAYPHLVGTASIEDVISRKRGKYGTYSKYWDDE